MTGSHKTVELHVAHHQNAFDYTPVRGRCRLAARGRTAERFEHLDRGPGAGGDRDRRSPPPSPPSTSGSPDSPRRSTRRTGPAPARLPESPSAAAPRAPPAGCRAGRPVAAARCPVARRSRTPASCRTGEQRRVGSQHEPGEVGAVGLPRPPARNACSAANSARPCCRIRFQSPICPFARSVRIQRWSRCVWRHSSITARCPVNSGAKSGGCGLASGVGHVAGEREPAERVPRERVLPPQHREHVRVRPHRVERQAEEQFVGRGERLRRRVPGLLRLVHLLRGQPRGGSRGRAARTRGPLVERDAVPHAAGRRLVVAQVPVVPPAAGA